MLRQLILAAATLVIMRTALAADWPLFRGPDRNGLSSEEKTPLNWSKEKNVKWRVELPYGGNSSPIVSAGRVFLTCAQDKSGMQRSLYCFDRATGKQLWVKTVEYSTAEKTHDTNPHCASSPAADGQRVYVWHGSAGLFAYDYEGNQLWKRDVGTMRHIWGWASSPIVKGDVVYLNCGPGSNAFVGAFNAKTGDIVWKTEEPGGADDKSAKTGSWMGTWTTPLFAKVGGRDLLLCNQPFAMKGYDPNSGEVVWSCDGLGPLSYTDPVLSADGATGVGMSGFGGPAIGFKLEGQGDVSAKSRLWRVEGNPQRIAGGIIIGDHLYVANEPDVWCIDIKTGKPAWKTKLGAHNFWSPISGTKDRLYITSRSGTTFVMSPHPKKFVQLAENVIDESCNASIAISDGQLFLRTFKALYCIEEK